MMVGMYENKRVLLIGGGGTLGIYTAEELLRLGVAVDIICLEDTQLNKENLRFIKASASIDMLKELFAKEEYDGIVNYLHYPNAEEYEEYHGFLCENTQHLIVMSSYRVYSDKQIPITESCPFLLDVSDDRDFIDNEKYAISKAKIEQIARKDSQHTNWTIIRPVISFSDRRVDMFMYSGHQIIDAIKSGKKLLMPIEARNLTAGLDWAGNSGKIIANLLFKEDVVGEAYTVSSAQNLTWGEIADIYTELTGLCFKWVDTQKFLAETEFIYSSEWAYKYDRMFDRKVDNTKVLKATGLKKDDFLSIKDGMKVELAKLLK